MYKLLSGVTLIGISLLMTLGFAKAELEENRVVETLTFGLVVVLPLSGGIGLLHSHHRDRHRLQNNKAAIAQNTFKSAILNLAKTQGGKLTIVEIMADLALSAEQTQQTLDALMHDQLADLEVTESGQLVYTFPGIQALPEKSTSESITHS